jgi:Flp pilus assembly pilin Flp
MPDTCRCRSAGAVEEGTVKFLSDERGQDLTEYTLLLAFVVLASAALLILNAQSVKGIWTSTNTMILTANNAAQGGTS